MPRRHRPSILDQPIQDLATHPADRVSVKALAEYWDKDPRVVTNLIEKGDIPAVKIGRAWEIHLTPSMRARFTVSRETST